MLGLGNTNTKGGVITSTSWENNYSVDLDGTNDYISMGDNNLFSFGDGSNDSAFSVSIWVYADDWTNSGIFCKENSAREYQLIADGSDKIRFRLWDPSASNAYIHSKLDSVISQSAWHHLAFTYDGSSDKAGLTIYVNGTAPAQTKGSSGTYVAMENGGDSLLLGLQDRSNQFFEGKVDECGLWNVELDSDAVAAIYNSGDPFDLTSNNGNYDNSSSLTGYWRMEENTGTSVQDSSSNSNSGTLTNGAAWSSSTP